MAVVILLRLRSGGGLGMWRNEKRPMADEAIGRFYSKRILTGH